MPDMVSITNLKIIVDEVCDEAIRNVAAGVVVAFMEGHGYGDALERFSLMLEKVAEARKALTVRLEN